MAKTSYDPGTATTPRALGGDLYAVDSFRAEGKSYTVNADAGTCDCLHFATRLAGIERAECKHLKLVRDHLAATAPTALQAASEKARALREDELLRLARQYQGQAAGAACLLELAARQAAAERDVMLRDVFK